MLRSQASLGPIVLHVAGQQGNSMPALGCAGGADTAASSLGDKASEGASQLAQQGGSLPDAAASASQAASQTVDAAGDMMWGQPEVTLP